MYTQPGLIFMSSQANQTAIEGILTNEKGLFCSPEWKPILTVAAHARLANWLRENPPGIEMKEEEKHRYSEAARVLNLIATMPVHEPWHNSLLPGDYAPSKMTEPRYGSAKSYSIMSVSVGSNKSSHKTAVTGGPKEWGWEAMAAIDSGFGTKGLKHIADLAKNQTGEMTLPSSSVLARVKKQQQAFNDGRITVTNNSAEDALSSAAAAVIFLGREKGIGGYVDKHDQAGPIGGARLFESPAAAARTARAHGWQGKCIIALVRVQLVGLDVSADHQVKGSEPLMAAIAKVEREALWEALNRATIEDLTEQLESRKSDDATAGTEAPIDATPKKRRM
jgi:hypothetical protein